MTYSPAELAAVGSEAEGSSEVFLSFSVDYRADFDPLIYSSKVQLGSKSKHFMARFGLEFPLLTSVDTSLGYSFDEIGLAAYAGVGAETLILNLFGAYALAGLELKVDDLGFFVEFQPTYWESTLGPRNSSFNKYRVGLNIHF